MWPQVAGFPYSKPHVQERMEPLGHTIPSRYLSHPRVDHENVFKDDHFNDLPRGFY